MKTVLSFPKFDATLDTDTCDALNNAELMLTLRLGFKQVNPTGGAAQGTYNDFGDSSGTPRQIVKWKATDWHLWKSQFVKSAQLYWNGKFWLLNRAGLFPFQAGKQVLIPNVWCRFDLVGSDAGAGVHHHVIEVVRLHKSETWFGSHSTLYDSLDTLSVRKGTDSKGRKIMQRAHVHEVGHLLGLAHVDVGKAHCPASNTNDAACYGIADHDKYSVMGQGMQLRDAHATPWLNAMAEFAKKAKPSTLYASPPTLAGLSFTVARKRHYPRTVAEFEAGQAITKRLVHAP